MFHILYYYCSVLLWGRYLTYYFNPWAQTDRVRARIIQNEHKSERHGCQNVDRVIRSLQVRSAMMTPLSLAGCLIKHSWLSSVWWVGWPSLSPLTQRDVRQCWCLLSDVTE